jgi:hypothetical protein
LPEDLDGTLGPREATAAARALVEVCSNLLESVEQLEDRLDEADGLEEVMVGDLFEGLMETYAVMEAISEAYEQMLEESDPQMEQFLPHYDRAVDAIERLDSAFTEEKLVSLSLVVHLPLYWNWKESLAEPYRSAPPWWLDGTLEVVDARLRSLLEKQVVPGVARKQAGTAVSAFGHSPEILRRIGPRFALAAAGTSEEPAVLTVLEWYSPDKKYRACLSIPSREPASGILPLEVLTGLGEPARELSGQSVWLTGVEASVDEKGVARFPLEAVRRATESTRLILEVGSRGQVWTPAQ